MIAAMRIVLFGTYDEEAHPRVRVLREGLAQHGIQVDVCNVPLSFDTAARVRLAGQPWRAPAFAARVVWAWIRLLIRSRALGRPDVVLVGYLGVFDVHLARLRFRRSTVVLDQMVTLGGTVRDRTLDDTGTLTRILDWIDRAAASRADVVIVDTHAHAAALPDGVRHVVVPVGASAEWRATLPAADPGPDDLVRVVFFGLYTPLQGATVIGEALAELTEEDTIAITMIGSGQDRTATEVAAKDSGARIEWLDWVTADDLPAVVAGHHICLGIFGTNPKALIVVPNKVYQGAAAGAAIITSDSPTQRQALGNAATLVPPGDPAALAAALRALATDRERLAQERRHAARWADQNGPEDIARALLDALPGTRSFDSDPTSSPRIPPTDAP